MLMDLLQHISLYILTKIHCIKYVSLKTHVDCRRNHKWLDLWRINLALNMPKVAMKAHIPVWCSLAQTLTIILSQEHHSHSHRDKVNLTIWFSHDDKEFDENLVETKNIPNMVKLKAIPYLRWYKLAANMARVMNLS